MCILFGKKTGFSPEKNVFFDVFSFFLSPCLICFRSFVIVFRSFLWVFIPLLSCFFSVLIMVGFLGLVGWKVTVISSNFIALMLILTMAMNIHMSTRFIQLRKNYPNKNNYEIISLTTKKMFLRGIFEELLWFLRGNTDSKILENKKVNIWKWNSSKEFINNMGLPYREGDIGNMYGFQLKHAGVDYSGCDTDYTDQGFNQIDYCLHLLKNHCSLSLVELYRNFWALRDYESY